MLVATHTLTAYDALRERAFDAMLARTANPSLDAAVRVVDIDRQSLERHGPWPWSRDQIARLLKDVLAAGPTAVGLDILIDGPDERSPAALARRLSELTGSSAAADLAAGLADGDAQLAAAITRKPVVLGLALDPERPSDPLPPAPILARGDLDLSAIWQAAGAAGPPPSVADAAAGLGVLALAGDADGHVRRVPLLTAAGAQLRPGLALETVRVARRSAAFILGGDNLVRAGSLSVPFSSEATLRLLPPSLTALQRRTVSALDVTSPQSRAELAGKIVLIGSSAPELGGLRLVSGGELVPTVHTQANAAAQLIAGVHPQRLHRADIQEPLALAAAILAGLLAALRMPPLRAALLTASLTAGWILLAILALTTRQWLVDPLAVPLALLASFAVSALIVAIHTRRREAALRRRFEQHLAPELVTRIAQDPSLLKLAGETRLASILFTDVEGFTAMTERSDPALLIRVLDRYIDEMSAVVVAHGGMVEKIVGDGFHALFNAPLDLDGHADKAVACARAIREFSERFAAEPEPRALGFGRTRIGVETGPVIVGDVGGGTRLDYTAYGNAMNTAARLEAANKDLGSAICIGPGTAAMLADASMLRPLGMIEVRGRAEALSVYDIWPDAMPPAERTAHLEALANAATAPDATRSTLARIATRHPGDLALARLIERLA
jgi:adenylate cyclase